MLKMATFELVFNVSFWPLSGRLFNVWLLWQRRWKEVFWTSVILRWKKSLNMSFWWSKMSF